MIIAGCMANTKPPAYRKICIVQNGLGVFQVIGACGIATLT